MKDIVQKYYAQRSEREIALNHLREQIKQDECDLRELNKTIEAIRQDVKELKEMIKYLRENFTS